MGLKELLARVIEKRREKAEALKNMESQVRMERSVHERFKSSNERELERFLEEARQKKIKEQLDLHRDQVQRDWWSSKNNVLNQKNIFTNRGNGILQTPNMFKTKVASQKGSVYFR